MILISICYPERHKILHKCKLFIYSNNDFNIDLLSRETQNFT
jgi:hypothetical protein